jgi:TRAP-type uncharacterized transport system substrate-binding protein
MSRSASILQFAASCVLALAGPFAASAQDSISSMELGNYPGSATNTRSNPGIASGSHSGLYLRFAEDLATLCAKPRDGKSPYRLNVVATEGGLDSVKRLRLESDVQMAVVQSDLWFYAKKLGDPATSAGNWLSTKTRESWRQIATDTRLILPLYTEQIHIVVTPYGKDQFKDLMGLFKSKARVSIGTTGSGSMITCTLLEEMLLRELRAKGAPETRWKPQFLPADVALETLAKGQGELDAVILVGGVPFPALEKFAMDQVKQGLFNRTTSVAQLALLPFGPEADAAVDRDPDFRGYVKTTIQSGDYEFLTAEKGAIATRGVTACLVTHRSYSADAKATEASRHRLLWVRHTLYRLLSNLDESSESGLIREFGMPQAGDKWKDVSDSLRRIERGDLTWASFGWQRHEDPVLTKMVDLWSGSTMTRPVGSFLIDPDKF